MIKLRPRGRFDKCMFWMLQASPCQPYRWETIQGPDEREEVICGFTSSFLDGHIGITELLASEGRVVTEATDMMSHGSKFTSVPPTDVGANIRPMAKFLVEDANIKQHREYRDRQEHREQLGVRHAEDINGR